LFFFQKGLFRSHWTELILYECIKNIEKNEPSLRDSIRKQEDIIREKFSEAWVTGFEHRIKDIQLDDLNDRHVLAAAIQCSAQYIVTENLGDFPREYLDQFGIEPMGSGSFLGMIYDHFPNEAHNVLLLVKENYRNPPYNASRFLELLNKNKMRELAERLNNNRNVPSTPKIIKSGSINVTKGSKGYET